ncbi:MAG: hypothetical protein JXA16_01020 [Bacteroidales bacterium]|nr:hypothetical protein [Bacteroidales bacterium]
MGLPGVTINVENGTLGSVSGTNDGITGMILSGVAVAEQIALNEPKQIFSLKEAEDLGLDEAYDAANGVDVYKQIKSFYSEGDSGLELWIMLVSQTVTLTEMADKTDANNAIKLLDAADGKIKVLAFSRVPDVSYVAVIVDGLDGDVFSAITNAQSLADYYASQMKPLRVVIAAREWTGVVSDLADLHERTDNRVVVSLLGLGEGNKNGDVGIILGRLASLPVQRNIGRVKDGSLSIETAYLTDGNTLESKESGISAIYEKGYLFVRRYVGKSGYFFADDLTATSLTDDFSSTARGRVIDKAISLAYATYINEVNDEVSINIDGTLPAAYVKALQAAVENSINQTMTAENEISSVKCLIETNQNVLATNKLMVSLKIIPVGYTKEFEISLGFSNPLNN